MDRTFSRRQVGTVAAAGLAAALLVPAGVARADFEPRTAWYVAEGYTGDGFDEFITILNVNGAGTATLTYYIEGESTPTVKTVALPAGSRTTITVHDAGVSGGLGRGKSHATKVETTVDTVVERPPSSSGRCISLTAQATGAGGMRYWVPPSRARRGTSPRATLAPALMST